MQRTARQRILDTATELFYLRGVSATGLNEVLAAAGAGKSQLYHYFRDKDDLVLAVAAGQAEGIVRGQQHLLDAMADGDDLRAWVDEAVRLHEQKGPIRCPLGALALELGARQPGLRQSLDAGFESWRRALAAALTTLQQKGHMRRDRDADDLAEVLLTAYEGGVLMSDVRGTTRPLRLALDNAVESMIVSPIRPPRRPGPVSASAAGPARPARR